MSNCISYLLCYIVMTQPMGHGFFYATEWIVVSLNYDHLFEDALTRLRVPFHHVFGPTQVSPSGSLPIYKPHGSINFFAQAFHQVAYGAPPPPPPPNMATTFYAGAGGQMNPHMPIAYACQPHPADVLGWVAQTIVHPVIANYMKGKDSDVNQPDLIAIRKQAIDMASKASHLLVVGVNPILDRTDDPFCATLLALDFESVIYVGVGETEGAKVKARYTHAELHLSGLRDYLQKVREAIE